MKLIGWLRLDRVRLVLDVWRFGPLDELAVEAIRRGGKTSHRHLARRLSRKNRGRVEAGWSPVLGQFVIARPRRQAADAD
jgi:hypothetical protein